MLSWAAKYTGTVDTYCPPLHTGGEGPNFCMLCPGRDFQTYVKAYEVRDYTGGKDKPSGAAASA